MKKLFIIIMMFLVTPVYAKTSILVEKSIQKMTVDTDTDHYEWPVSTAKPGHITPKGTFRPYSLETIHYSKEYDNVPMPNSIFFKGGYAIHATHYVRNLGKPTSHGCVRLSPVNAKTLFGIVSNDRKETKITIK